MGLWDTPVGDQPSFPGLAEHVKRLEDPEFRERFMRLVKERQETPEFQEELRKRLAPYQTKVTAECLHTMLD